MPIKSRKKNKEQVGVNSPSSVHYDGNVTIRKVIGKKVISKKVIHNAGCLPLFEFFGKCLTLYSEGNLSETGFFNSRPQYINGFYVDPNYIGNIQLSGNGRLKSYIKQSDVKSVISPNITSLSKQKDSWYRVDITFLLQDNNFLYTDSSVQSNNINVLALYSGQNIINQDNPHAFIVIDNTDDYLKYQQGVNYLITWQIKISN